MTPVYPTCWARAACSLWMPKHPFVQAAGNTAGDGFIPLSLEFQWCLRTKPGCSAPPEPEEFQGKS